MILQARTQLRRMSQILDFLAFLLTDLRHCSASHYLRLRSQILDFLIGFRVFVHFGTCEWLRRKSSNFRLLMFLLRYVKFRSQILDF